MEEVENYEDEAKESSDVDETIGKDVEWW